MRISDWSSDVCSSDLEVMGADLRVMKNGKLDYDGIIGPATRSALAQAVAAGRIVEINNLIVDKRIAELNTKGHKKSNSGWFARAESFRIAPAVSPGTSGTPRSEEHTSEIQSLMRTSDAVFCLTKKNNT